MFFPFILSQVMVQKLLENAKNDPSKSDAVEAEEDLDKEKEIRRRRVNSLIRRKRYKDVQKLVKNEGIKPWGRDTQAKVCQICFSFFLLSFFCSSRPLGMLYLHCADVVIFIF